MPSRVQAAALCLLLSGCASVNLPLCSAVAAMSWERGAPRDHVNRYARERAQQRSIAIDELSPYVAQYSGDLISVSWFAANYRHMLCAFSPERSPIPESLFLSCMSHADGWIGAVRAGSPEALVVQEKYTFACLDPLAMTP